MERAGSVNVPDKISVMPHKEQTRMPTRSRALSIRTGGMGAPPHRKDLK